MKFSTLSRVKRAVVVVAVVAVGGATGGRSEASPERVDQQVLTALELDQNPKRGAELFAKHCSECHGKEGFGSAVNGVPSLAGQRQAYLIKQLADFAEGERDNSRMHNVVSKVAIKQPQAWADIAGYLNRVAPTRFPRTGDGKAIELGEAIFREQCSSCHEEDGRGDDDGFVPSLRNQHYSYLAHQVRNFADWHRRNVDADLVRFLESLKPDEVAAVTDYISRLRGPTRDRDTLRDDGSVRN